MCVQTQHHIKPPLCQEFPGVLVWQQPKPCTNFSGKSPQKDGFRDYHRTITITFRYMRTLAADGSGTCFAHNQCSTSVSRLRRWKFRHGWQTNLKQEPSLAKGLAPYGLLVAPRMKRGLNQNCLKAIDQDSYSCWWFRYCLHQVQANR